MSLSVAHWNGVVFEEHAEELGFDEMGSFRSVLPIHWNDDGLLDYWVSEVRGTPLLYVSNGCSENTWLHVEAPEGTMVGFSLNGAQHKYRMRGSSSYAASRSPQQHIGLGSNSEIQDVRLRFPRSDEWYDLADVIVLPHRIKVSYRSED